MNKITIVGPGRVGESTAQILAKEELCRELVLLGRQEGAAKGIALDIQESAPLFGFDTRVMGSADPQDLRDSDLVIITAGFPRKPGMSRAELLDTNLAVIRGIVDNVLRYAPHALILMVTNPVDMLTQLAWHQTGWERRRVLGLSGVLDSARMASFVALETGFSVQDITALVIGGHGDDMVPLPRYTCVRGIPIDTFIDADKITRICEHTRKGGAEILALKETSSAYDSPAASIATMVDAMVYNRKRLLPCVAVLDGEYGQTGAAAGVPAVLGTGGVEKVIELPLTPDEREKFRHSVEQIRNGLKAYSREE